jgi:hypothetical protein
MDPITVGFDAVTALLSALSLFLSRPDTRHHGLRHLLEIYGEELLTIIDNGIRNRGRLIEQLVRYLPSLRTLEPEMMEQFFGETRLNLARD